MKKTKIWLLSLVGALIVFVIVARILAPGVILQRLNQTLAEMPGAYRVQIGDLRLSLFRMAYGFENVDVTLVPTKESQTVNGSGKRGGFEFCRVEDVDVSLSWHELFKARLLTDIVIQGARVILNPAVIDALKDPGTKSKDHADETASHLFPVRVALIELHASQLQFAQLVDQTEDQRWTLSALEAKLLNATPREQEPISYAWIQGTLMDSSRVKLNAKLKLLQKPVAWKVDTEIREFALPAANAVLLKVMPFNFSSGTLDLYSEVRSQKGHVEGYVKPFLKKVQVIQKDQSYKSVKHFAYEILGAIANAILRRSDDHSVATRVAFHTEDGSLKVDGGEALGKVLQHGFAEKIQPGIEDSLKFSDE